MIVVDSSVWIKLYRGRKRAPRKLLDLPVDPTLVVVGDIVLLEVLQGARDEGHAARLETELRAFRIASMLDPSTALEAARSYRLLRAAGVTVSKLPDLLIATYCVTHDYPVLHRDRDFDQLVRLIGLRALRLDSTELG